MDCIFTTEQQGEQTHRGSRRSFLRRAATAAAGAGAAVMAPDAARAALNDPQLIARAFRDIRQHENDHVASLVKLLGGNARPKPTFVHLRQADLLRFVRVSRILENTGAGAYTAAVSNFLDRFLLADAVSIALTEARHASYLDWLLELPITTNVAGRPLSFEIGLSPQEVGNIVGRFIANLNGGPPLTYNGNPSSASAANDIAILNFALALEYLEAEFYNLNVPIFFAGIGG